MKKVINPGYSTYSVTCDICRCEFEYDLSEINEGYVTCPYCGHKVMHFSHNYKLELHKNEMNCEKCICPNCVKYQTDKCSKINSSCDVHGYIVSCKDFEGIENDES